MRDDHAHLWPGVPMALASAALFGASAPLSKLLVGVADPWLMAGVLYLGAGLGLAALSLFRRPLGLENPETPLGRADLPWIGATALFGGVLGPILLLFGLASASAAAGSLLLNLEGLATLAIAWLVFRENVDRRLLIGAAAILAGATLLSLKNGSFALEPGSLLIAGACLCWGIDNNLSRKLSAADPVQVAMVKGLVAGSTNLVLALAEGAALPSLPVLAAGAVVGFFGIGLSLVFFMLALRHLGTARSGAYFSTAPFIGAVIGLILFRDPLTLTLVAAGALIAIGLWLHLSERHDHWHEHEALEHEHLHVHDEHHRHDHEGPVTEPHSHWHRHEPMRHRHAHFPDLHHRHSHP